MGPILTDSEIRVSRNLAGKKSASYFCDDAIWFFRDLTRQRPKSAFDHPFLAVLRECHEKYGLKEYFAYQPDYADKIRIMSRMMSENGCEFVFMEELTDGRS